MDFEKKYKEALEKAKSIYRDAKEAGCSHTDWLEHIFPQLAESEDERIRQSLLAYIKGESKRLDTKKWIAYLEKQKEQKLIPSRETILGIWELGNLWKENPEKREGLSQLEYIQKYWAEKCDYLIEQKPAEDERIRKHIIEILGRLSPLNFDGNEKGQCIAYLEKQKPAEWSEEDIEECFKYHFCVTGLHGHTISEVFREGMNAVLGDIQTGRKPICSHWKPSKEQMEALKKVAYNLVGTGTETDVHLVQLYEQLKKL